jgi:hypothetical protein
MDDDNEYTYIKTDTIIGYNVPFIYKKCIVLHVYNLFLTKEYNPQFYSNIFNDYNDKSNVLITICAKSVVNNQNIILLPFKPYKKFVKYS